MITPIKTVVNSYLNTPRLLSQHRLYRYFYVSGMISLVIGLIVLLIVRYFSDDLGNFIISLIPFLDDVAFAEISAHIISGFLIILLFFLAYKYLILILVGPFLGPLSEKIESISSSTYIKNTDNLNDTTYKMIRGIRVSSKSIIKELLYTIPLIILSLIPVLNIVSTALIFIIQSYYAGIGALDYYHERHRNVSETFAYARHHRIFTTAIGAAYLGILLIPILGLFIAPVITCVAATLAGVRNDGK